MLQSTLRTLAGAFILLGAGLTAAEDDVPFDIGDEPPQWLGVGPDGDDIRLTDSPDQVRVVTFWASWCAPCLTELEALEAFRENIPASELEIFAVNVHEFDPDKALQIRRRYDDAGFLFSADPKREIITEHGIMSIPLMLMIDHNGQLRQVHQGYTEEKLDQITDQLNSLLAEQIRDRRSEAGLSGR